MPIPISEELEAVINIGKQAYIDFDLVELRKGISKAGYTEDDLGFTVDEVEAYKKNYPKTSDKYVGKVYDPKNGKLNDLNENNVDIYTKNASTALDHFFFKLLKTILDYVRNYELSVVSLVPDLTVSFPFIRKSKFEEWGANSIARSLGETFVPKFVDNEKLFQKVLWTLVVLELVNALAKKNIITNAPGVSGIISTQLNIRRDGARDFVTQYLDKHPDLKGNVDKFCASYLNMDFEYYAKTETGQEAINKNKRLISGIFDAAKKAFPLIFQKPALAEASSVSTIGVGAVTSTSASSISAGGVAAAPASEVSESVSSTAAVMTTVIVPSEKKASSSMNISSNTTAKADSEKFEDHESIEESGSEDNEGDVFFDAEEYKQDENNKNDVLIVSEEKQVNQAPIVQQSEEVKPEKPVKEASSEEQVKQTAPSQFFHPSQTSNPDDELKKAKEILNIAIDKWKSDPYKDPITGEKIKPTSAAYILSNDKDRADGLITLINNASDINIVKNLVAGLIKHGTTSGQYSTSFSPIGVEHSLNRTLAKQFCPDACHKDNTKRDLKHGLRTVTSLPLKEIITKLDFSSAQKLEAKEDVKTRKRAEANASSNTYANDKGERKAPSLSKKDD